MGQATPFDQRLEALLEPTVSALGFEMVRVRLFGQKRRTLQIMAERSDGTMTVDDCAQLSRAVSAILDVEDPISGEFDLEVSSPGIDRPLTRLKDFATWAGFEARLELHHAIDGRRRFKGRLKGVEDGDILMVLADTVDAEAPARLPFEALSDARLVITDDLLAATQARQSDHGEMTDGQVAQGALIEPGADWNLEDAPEGDEDVR